MKTTGTFFMQDFSTPGIESTVGLKFWRIVALVIAISAVVFISVVPQVSNDFWLQAKVGEMIADSHTIPQTVLFPFTEAKDQPFNAHEWLPSLFFYWLINTVGESGLPLAMGVAGLVFLCVMTLLAYQRSEGNLPLALLMGLLAVGVENQRHYLRPELLSLIMLGIYWYFLESCRQGSHSGRWLGAWLIVVLWTNTHGSFILAPIVSAIYAAGIWLDARWPPTDGKAILKAEAQPFLWFTVAALIATLINPVGIDLLRFVFDFGSAESTKLMVAEWLPTFDARWRDNRGFWIGVGCGC